jgi:hypothetical protein
LRSKWRGIIGAIALVLEAGCSTNAARVDAGATGGAGGSGAVGGPGGAGGSDASPEASGPVGDDRLFVPEGLPNMNGDGQDDGLVLIAFTLVPGATGPSFYAAVQNVWSTPLCEAGMMISFYDKNNQLVGTTASVLQSGSFYQMSDGTVLPCVDPGQIAMTGATGLPSTVVIDQLGSLVHLFPSFNLTVVPVGTLAVSGVASAGADGGTGYTGVVTNQIGSTLSNPSVTIFPVNRVGRPLGMATASTTADLPAGGSWSFATGAVDDPGVGQVAFASGSVP